MSRKCHYYEAIQYVLEPENKKFSTISDILYTYDHCRPTIVRQSEQTKQGQLNPFDSHEFGESKFRRRFSSGRH